MKTPRVWKEFLKNEDNKKELISFILNEWQTDTYYNYYTIGKFILHVTMHAFALQV